MTDFATHPAAELLPLLTGQEFTELVESIKSSGLLEPIVVHEGQILDGRNRYRACKEAGVAPRIEEWDGRGGSPLRYALSMNVDRRHLTPSQRAMLAVDVLPALELEAATRREATQGRPKTGGNRATGFGPPRKARDDAAAALRANPRYVQDAKAIVQADPVLAEQVRAGARTIPEAKRELAKRETAERIEAAREGIAQTDPVQSLDRLVGAVNAGNRPPFSVILADPPWSYQNWSETKQGAAAAIYRTMSVSDIASLPVGELADPEACALLLWGTWPKLREAWSVMDAWGFRYVTCAFVWNKIYADGSPYCGLGFYTRSGSEFCLLGLKGKLARASDDVLQVISAPIGRHSEKPFEIYDRIDRLWPDAIAVGDEPPRRLELFCREPRPGYVSWGDEIGGEE